MKKLSQNLEDVKPGFSKKGLHLDDWIYRENSIGQFLEWCKTVDGTLSAVLVRFIKVGKKVALVRG